VAGSSNFFSLNMDKCQHVNETFFNIKTKYKSTQKNHFAFLRVEVLKFLACCFFFVLAKILGKGRVSKELDWYKFI
jgi:hypothetical protein